MEYRSRKQRYAARSAEGPATGHTDFPAHLYCGEFHGTRTFVVSSTIKFEIQVARFLVGYRLYRFLEV